jgi:hypothetical protein
LKVKLQHDTLADVIGVVIPREGVERIASASVSPSWRAMA